MFIDPIQLQQISTLSNDTTVTNTATTNKVEIPFKSILTDAIADVNETANTLDNEVLKLSTGQSEDLHDITIASTKYSMAVEMFVQIRNKSLDAFNQMMNMNI